VPICGCGWSGDVRVTASVVAAACCVISCSIASTRPVALHSTQYTGRACIIQHTVHRAQCTNVTFVLATIRSDKEICCRALSDEDAD
jgi:hypothetical protein